MSNRSERVSIKKKLTLMMMRTRAYSGGPRAVVGMCRGDRPAPIRTYHGGLPASARIYPVVAALAVALLVAPVSPAGAQQQSQDARAELAAVTELGRLFGSIVRMHTVDNDLTVRAHQTDALRAITREVAAAGHLSAAQANDMIDDLRTTILEPDQLEYIDGRTTSASSSPGSGSTSATPSRAPAPAGGAPAPSSDSSGDGSGDQSSSRGADRSQPAAQTQSSAPANPLLDTGRQIGRFFAELCELLEEIE